MAGGKTSVWTRLANGIGDAASRFDQRLNSIERRLERVEAKLDS
jgi:hypothetical protein